MVAPVGFLVLSFCSLLFLGILVLVTNPRRETNLLFFFVCLALSSWVLCNIFVYGSNDHMLVETAGRLAFAFGTLPFPLILVFFLKFPVNHPLLKRKETLPAIAAPAALLFPLSLTDMVQRGVIFSEAGRAPIYGPLHPLYACTLMIYTGFCLAVPLSNLRRLTDPIERAQLKMIFIGFCTLGIGAATLQLILPFLAGTRPLPGVAPSLTAVLAGLIGYSIFRYRFLDVVVVLRGMLIFACVALVMACFVFLVSAILLDLGPEPDRTEVVMRAILAALVGGAFLPVARSFSERFIDKYVFPGHYNYQQDLRKFSEKLIVFHDLARLRDFLTRSLAALMGTTRCELFIMRGKQFLFSTDQALVASCRFFLEAAKKKGDVLITYELRRILEPDEFRIFKINFDRLGARAVVRLATRDGAVGLLCLGEKVNGEIFSNEDINFLVTIGNHVAAVIENALLYRDIAAVKDYMDSLLEQMTCGVVAVDVNLLITKINNKAAELLCVGSHSVLGKTSEVLPHEVSGALKSTITDREPIANLEVRLELGDSQIRSVGVSTTVLYGSDGDAVGALAVITDLTEIKRLEAEVRRVERLATVGTLAAGMAHEIKNPLVSLKTFAQLLPTKYDDPDFRETFSQIASAEIERINSLVEQLLRFARPPKPIPMPIDLHEPVEQTLALLSSELAKKAVFVERRYHEGPLMVFADSEQLKQVFMNVVLNATEAFLPGEAAKIEVSTGVRRRWGWPPVAFFAKLPDGYTQGNQEAWVRIADNGPGIRESHLKHVFDPFFTTKDTGHGLGLSIAHGIVREHKGTITAENRPEGGAAFTIALPLLEVEAAAGSGDADELRADRLA